MTGSVGLGVAVGLGNVSHWFVVILRWGETASTVILGASRAVSS